MLFQLVSIGNDRVKLENQLRGLKGEKRRLAKARQEVSPASSRGEMLRGRSRCDTGSSMRSEDESAVDAEDAMETDSFSESVSDTGTLGSGIGQRSRTDSKEQVFAKYRRHSFRVGYFEEEDKEGSNSKRGNHSNVTNTHSATTT